MSRREMMIEISGDMGGEVGASSRLVGRLLDTPTAETIWRALPIRGRVGRWGDEIYWYVSELTAAREADARQVVEPGDLCFWCEGGAIALPFGPTPISLRGECRLIAPVNVWGQLVGDPARLAQVEEGSAIELKRRDPADRGVA